MTLIHRPAWSYPRMLVVAGLPVAMVAVLLAVAPLVVAEQPPASAEQLAIYVGKIRPLLEERCFSCHGGLKQEAGLRLDTVPLMLEGGESGPASCLRPPWQEKHRSSSSGRILPT